MSRKFHARTNVPGGRLFNRRDFLKMGGAGLAGAALLGTAGCGGGGGPQRAEDGSLVFTFSMGRDDTGTLTQLVDRFNEQFKGEYKANYRVMPQDTGQYFSQLRTEFQGQGEIDLIGGDVIWPAQFAANGWIADLSERFPDSERQKFLPGPIESNVYEGAIYGVPWYTDAGLLYYRKDLLEDSGINEPPQTWEELGQITQQVMEESGTANGFVFQGSDYEGGTVNGLEYIYSHGGQVLDPNDASKVVIDSPESVAALETERGMVADGIAPQSVVNYTETESQGVFLTGDAVFLRGWPYMYSLVGSEDFPGLDPEQVDIATLPAGEGGQSSPGLGGWNFYISTISDEETQDAAYEFIKFATDPEQQKIRALEGAFLPTLNDLYQDQEIIENVPVIRLAGEQALESTVPRPVSPVYSDMSLEMAEQFKASLNGDTPPGEAIGTLQSSLQDIADQAPS
jgi:multiple sugar transport system substrate-binding protein